MKTINKDEGIKIEEVKVEDAEWKLVDPNQVPAYKFESEGDSLTCIYNRMKSGVGPNNSNLYTVTEEPSGKEYVVWGSDVLDNRMSSIKQGSLIKIVYNGKKISEKSKRPYYDYAVYTHV
jgi:hypothetical protein